MPIVGAVREPPLAGGQMPIVNQKAKTKRQKGKIKNNAQPLMRAGHGLAATNKEERALA